MVNFIGLKRDTFLKQYKSLYRFITVERLIEQLESKTFAFLNPTIWEDPYEKYFIEKKYIIRGKPMYLPMRDRVFCVCVSGTTSSEAFWKVYAPKENGVRLSYRTEDFLEVLDTITDCEIHIGKVKYLITKVFSNPPIDKKSLLEEIDNNNINGQQLKLLLRKRTSFRYENEVRIVCVPKVLSTDKKVLKIPMDIKIFTKTYLFDPRMGKYHFSLIKESLLEKYGIAASHSHLYKLPLLKPIVLK